MESQNAYQILGLRKGATDDEIKKAWVEMVRDIDQELHTDQFISVKTAYETLRDPAKRAREDILIYNYIKGGFKFTADEQTQDADPVVLQAVQQNEQLYSQNPNNTEHQAAYIKALMMRSFKKFLKKQWAEAIEDLQRVLTIDPAHQRAKHNLLYSYLTLGYGYADHGLHDSAVELWEKALQMNPDDDRVLHNLAIANEFAGRNDLAKRYWGETLRRWQTRLNSDPDDVYMRNCIIEVRRHHGGQNLHPDGKNKDPESSIREYREILKINPNDFEAQYKIASALYEQHNWAEAIKTLAILMKSHPKNVEVMNMLGWSLLQSGQIEQAFQIWNRSLAMDPKNASTREAVVKARMDLGKAYRSRGMHTQALAQFKALEKFLPQSPELMLEIGQTYMAKGDKRAAAVAFEQVMRMDPKNRTARQFISDMKLRT